MKPSLFLLVLLLDVLAVSTASAATISVAEGPGANGIERVWVTANGYTLSYYLPIGTPWQGWSGYAKYQSEVIAPNGGSKYYATVALGRAAFNAGKL